MLFSYLANLYIQGGDSVKLNYKRTFFIGLAFMSISAFWQLYDGIVPLILDNTFGLGETLTGGIMALDNILALFLLPLFGAFSDRVDTRFGKRMPFIIIGTVCAVIFMTILPYADQTRNFPLFFVSLGLLLLAMGVYRSPAVALMPDLTPKPLRSQANAVINLMGAAGGILTLGFISLLISEEANPDYTMVFAAVSALMVAAVGVLVLTIREKKLAEELAKQEPIFTGQGSTVEQGPTAADQGPTLSEQQPIDMGDMGTVEPSDGIRESGHRDNNHGTDHQGTGSGGSLPREVRRSLFFLLASIFLWFTAYNAVTTAFSRYAGRVWGLQGGGFANALMVATGAAIVSYIPIGFVSGSIGRKKTILIGILIMTASYFTGFLFTQYSLDQHCLRLYGNRMVGDQCQFLSHGGGNEPQRRCGEVYGLLLYLLYGGADHNAHPVRISAGDNLLPDAVSLCDGIFSAVLLYHAYGAPRRLQTAEKGKQTGAI